MPTLIADGALDRDITAAEQFAHMETLVASIGGNPKKVLLVPPDYTRLNSGAGQLTAMLYRIFSASAQVDILPALGTHVAMPEHELRDMFGPDIPLERFLVHDWRNGLVPLGEISGELIQEWSEGRVDYPVKIEISKTLVEGNYDLIFSVGQIVPHEVVGMANYTKNICVGIGGGDTIHKSHFLGAAYGMERIMGQADSPPRQVFNYGCNTFLKDFPIHYVLTVMQKDLNSGRMQMRGLYAGSGDQLFEEGCRLCQQVNINLLDRPIKKAVAFLDPHEFKSTWLGNKAVYRTRMAIEDEGELIVLAPALREFGEDPAIDRLIRKYGYRTTPEILAFVEQDDELRQNLSAAAHLIHGSSEGRFTVTYCPGPAISHDEIRSVGYEAGDLDAMMKRYNPDKLKDGFNIMPDGEEIFFVSNPALGLWALRERFMQ